MAVSLRRLQQKVRARVLGSSCGKGSSCTSLPPRFAHLPHQREADSKECRRDTKVPARDCHNQCAHWFRNDRGGSAWRNTGVPARGAGMPAPYRVSNEGACTGGQSRPPLRILLGCLHVRGVIQRFRGSVQFSPFLSRQPERAAGICRCPAGIFHRSPQAGGQACSRSGC